MGYFEHFSKIFDILSKFVKTKSDITSSNWERSARSGVDMNFGQRAYGCKKLNDGILEAAEVHFASGRRTVVSGARVVSGVKEKSI